MTVSQIDLHRQGKAGTLTDAEVAAGAGIALSKLAEAVVQADGGQAMTGNLPMGGNKVTGAADGTADSDLATVGQARQYSQGKDRKDAVQVATTANVNLATGLANGQTIDGVTLVTGWRVLVKDQSVGSQNGIYDVPASGAASRSADANLSAEVTNGMSTWVDGGTQANQEWTLNTNDPITLDTTALVFVQTGSGAGGTVTSVSVVSANGFAGSVATGTSTPAITITTTQTGVLKGNGTAVSAAVAGTDYLAPSSVVTRETPTGSVNGSNAAFGLANTPIAGTEQVFLNGILQEPGAGNDYTISGATITYLTAPLSGDRIRVTYLK